MTSTPRPVELRYDPAAIDRKWQDRWERDGIHRVDNEDPRPKWYEMTMYPYPSGDLHIGHWYAMAPADCHARFRRMQGYNVLHPIGFDAFGLPAENAAISRGIHPHTWTMENIANMRRQLRSIGAVYDWDREIVCCLPEYYRWNQWLFLQFYKAGLAYRGRAPVVWCPSCQTVLANEQVLNGACERCGATITRRDLEQWFLRITEFADRLLDFRGLEDWPDKILTMQTNWIGRSEGVEIAFDISEYGLETKELKTFTTRVDTVFGVTFIVLAPEHPLVEQLTADDQRAAVADYIEQARRTSEIERLSTETEKTGVPLGSYAVNRLNGERVPIYTGDYVLMGYGSGAVMGVPAHDSRDFAFAGKYGLPVRIVIAPITWDGSDLTEAYLDDGFMTNSGKYEGMTDEEGKQAIADDIEKNGWGRRTVSYRVRDWIISRQRYWGTPIPMVYCDQCGIVPVPEDSLPVLLPPDAEFKPTGESPLAANADFVNAACPQCNGPARRETDTMDTFFDSSWYMLRYLDPNYDQGPFDPDLARQWMPVGQYTGGAEHAVMHLLYSRFFVKALHDMGVLDFDEPFLRLYNQGVILGEDHEKDEQEPGQRCQSRRGRGPTGRRRCPVLPHVHRSLGPGRALERRGNHRHRPLAQPGLGPGGTGPIPLGCGSPGPGIGPTDPTGPAPDHSQMLQRPRPVQVQHCHCRFDGVFQSPEPGLGRFQRGPGDMGAVRGEFSAAAGADGPAFYRRALGEEGVALQHPPAELSRPGTRSLPPTT